MNLIYDLDGGLSTEVVNISLSTTMSKDSHLNIDSNFKVRYEPRVVINLDISIVYTMENVNWLIDWFRGSFSKPIKKTLCMGDRTFHGCVLISYDSNHNYDFNAYGNSQINIELGVDSIEIGTDFQSSYKAHKRDIAISKILDE